MLPSFIVVSGLPASGKSTLGKAVAGALALPLLDKDDFLERLFEARGVGDIAWRNLLSRVADEGLQREVQAQVGAVIASWWRHPKSGSGSGTPTNWLPTLPGEVVELHCLCSPSVAVTRFLGRKRHTGHLDGRYTRAALLESFELQASFGPLAVGRLVQVNTEALPQTVEALSEVLLQVRRRSSHASAAA